MQRKWMSWQTLVVMVGIWIKCSFRCLDLLGLDYWGVLLCKLNSSILAEIFPPLFQQGSYLLAASNDFASRIWTVDDYRLRVRPSQENYYCLPTSRGYQGTTHRELQVCSFRRIVCLFLRIILDSPALCCPPWGNLCFHFHFVQDSVSKYLQQKTLTFP